MEEQKERRKLEKFWTSLVVQWLRICRPMQFPVQEDPTCHGATTPQHCNYWRPLALEPVLNNKENPHTTTGETQSAAMKIQHSQRWINKGFKKENLKSLIPS